VIETASGLIRATLRTNRVSDRYRPCGRKSPPADVPFEAESRRSKRCHGVHRTSPRISFHLTTISALLGDILPIDRNLAVGLHEQSNKVPNIIVMLQRKVDAAERRCWQSAVGRQSCSRARSGIKGKGLAALPGAEREVNIGRCMPATNAEIPIPISPACRRIDASIVHLAGTAFMRDRWKGMATRSPWPGAR
jgi:hypothetical protein